MGDFRVKLPTLSVSDPYPITAIAFAEDGYSFYYGGLDNTIKVWDLRQRGITIKLTGHEDTITGLRVSPNGAFLLSNSMDNTLRIWDMRPYASKSRIEKIMTGHIHTFEKNLIKCDWSADGSLVSAGSGDNTSCIWDVTSRKIVNKIPGHVGSVNEVVFNQKQPIIGSCSSDKHISLGEM